MNLTTPTKELRALFEKAESQGWTITRTKGSHFRCVPPDPSQGIVIVAGTPYNPGFEHMKALNRMKKRGYRDE